MDRHTLKENQKFVNGNSAKVITATCGRCFAFRSRRGAWLFEFDGTQFLCRCCIDSLNTERLEHYRIAESLIDGGAA